MFAIAFSIMGLVPSIASTIAFSLPAGPVGMVWVRLAPSSIALVVWRLICDRAGVVRCEYLYSRGCAGYGMVKSAILGARGHVIDKQLVGFGVCNAYSRGSILVDSLFRWRKVQESVELPDRVFQHVGSDWRHMLSGL